MSLLFNDVQMDQETARSTPVLKLMQSLSRNSYDWISPIRVINSLKQQSLGNEYAKSGHLFIVSLLKYIMMLLKCKMFSASFLHLIKTLIACEVMQIRFFFGENVVKQCI